MHIIRDTRVRCFVRTQREISDTQQHRKCNKIKAQILTKTKVHWLVTNTQLTRQNLEKMRNSAQINDDVASDPTVTSLICS